MRGHPLGDGVEIEFECSHVAERLERFVQLPLAQLSPCAHPHSQEGEKMFSEGWSFTLGLPTSCDADLVQLLGSLKAGGMEGREINLSMCVPHQ